MARKTSDIALLLGSRGKARKSSGLLAFVRAAWQSLAPRSQWREDRRGSLQVPGWLAGAALLVAFGGGYLLGGRLGKPAENGGVGLRAKGDQGQRTQFLDADGSARGREAFIVSAYPRLPEADAKAAAVALSEWLRGKKLQRAFPYLSPAADGGKLWTVAVFFDGETDGKKTRELLVGIGEDAPDPMFNHWRNTTPEWPIARKTL